MGYDDEITATFRDTIRREREHRAWTQTQLAQKMTDHGIPTQWPAINKIETGNRNITISEAATLANIFGITVTRLIGHKPQPAADRDYALRRLQEAVSDAHRTTRIAIRDITNALPDTNLSGTQTALNQLDQAATELARLGGTIAEKRGNHTITH